MVATDLIKASRGKALLENATEKGRYLLSSAETAEKARGSPSNAVKGGYSPQPSGGAE